MKRLGRHWQQSSSNSRLCSTPSPTHPSKFLLHTTTVLVRTYYKIDIIHVEPIPFVIFNSVLSWIDRLLSRSLWQQAYCCSNRKQYGPLSWYCRCLQTQLQKVCRYFHESASCGFYEKVMLLLSCSRDEVGTYVRAYGHFLRPLLFCNFPGSNKYKPKIIPQW